MKLRRRRNLEMLSLVETYCQPAPSYSAVGAMERRLERRIAELEQRVKLLSESLARGYEHDGAS